jgi:hypothetical protein
MKRVFAFVVLWSLRILLLPAFLLLICGMTAPSFKVAVYQAGAMLVALAVLVGFVVLMGLLHGWAEENSR